MQILVRSTLDIKIKTFNKVFALMITHIVITVLASLISITLPCCKHVMNRMVNDWFIHFNILTDIELLDDFLCNSGFYLSYIVFCTSAC